MRPLNYPQKFAARIASIAIMTSMFAPLLQAKESEGNVQPHANSPKAKNQRDKSPANAPKFEGIGTLYVKLLEPQIVCRTRESADVVNLIASEELDEGTRKKVAPLALSLCKPVSSDDPFEVMQVITNEGVIEIKSTGVEAVTGFIPMNSMREEGLAFVLRVHPGVSGGLKDLLEKFNPQSPGPKKAPDHRQEGSSASKSAI